MDVLGQFHARSEGIRILNLLLVWSFFLLVVTKLNVKLTTTVHPNWLAIHNSKNVSTLAQQLHVERVVAVQKITNPFATANPVSYP